MSHTPEPWRITELDRVIADCMEKVNDDYFIADCFGPDAKENARRIVACVNACAGIETSVLEKEHVIDYHKNARQERDTFRELCAELLSSMEKINAQNIQIEVCEILKQSMERARSILGEKNG